jgi:hypothetical protein
MLPNFHGDDHLTAVNHVHVYLEALHLAFLSLEQVVNFDRVLQEVRPKELQAFLLLVKQALRA